MSGTLAHVARGMGQARGCHTKRATLVPWVFIAGLPQISRAPAPAASVFAEVVDVQTIESHPAVDLRTILPENRGHCRYLALVLLE